MNTVQVISERYHWINDLIKDIDMSEHNLGRQIRKRFSETAQAEATRRTLESQAAYDATWITLIEKELVDLPKVYHGPMKIQIKKEFYAPDMYVRIDPDCILCGKDAWFEDSKDWQDLIIGLLQDSGHLDPSHEWRMWTAESGMQGDSYHVYEGLCPEGSRKSTSEQLFIKWGAKHHGL